MHHSHRSRRSNKKNLNINKSMILEERSYVVSGKGFKTLKIKGYSNRNKLIESLKLKGFKPTSSVYITKSQARTKIEARNNRKGKKSKSRRSGRRRSMKTRQDIGVTY
jgi:hypothetical protein